MTVYDQRTGLGGLVSASLLGNFAAPTKRKAYFAFHYDDIMRVNNVRQSWKIGHPDTLLSPSFYDSSLWESKKLEGDEAVKNLIREGVGYTSAVCVLTGTQTWSRRWVQYEIARSVIDNRGLLAVHINNLTHHQRKTVDVFGLNPLDIMGIYKNQNGNFYLCKKQWITTNPLAGTGSWQWVPYEDYKHPVSIPRYLMALQNRMPVSLSAGALVYDFVGHAGSKNIGVWIDRAAQQVGR